MKQVKFIVILGLFLLIYPSSALGIEFKDTSNHWAQGYIKELSNRGYLQGYADGTFLPDKIMTKAEFIAVLLRSMNNSPAYNYTTPLEGHWADNQINEAIRQGIIVLSEYPLGFNKDNAINRAEVAAMVVRALGKDPNYAYASFSDNNTVNTNPYAGYIKVAHQEGLVTGYPDGEFKPYNYITRAQACSILSRYLTKTGSGATNNYNVSPTSPPSTRIASLVWDNYRYNPEYVNIYIDNQASIYYLSDVYIVSANVIKLGNINYNLNDKNLTLKLQDNYFNINKVYWVNGLATLELSKSSYKANDYWQNISYNDIDVYDEEGYKFSRIDNIEFKVNGKNTRYELGEIAVDLKNKLIIMDNTQYKPYRVEVRVKRYNNSAFTNWMPLADVRSKDGMLIFDCDDYYDRDYDYIDHDEVVFIFENQRYYSDETQILIDDDYYNFSRIYITNSDRFEYRNDRYYFKNSEIRIKSNSKNEYYKITSTEWKGNWLYINLVTR